MTNAEAKKINSIYSELIQIANKLGCTVLTDEPLKNHTSFKIGGPADLFIYANNTESLKVILNIIHKENMPFFILGNGTNLLVSDTGFRGIVLNLTKNHEKIIIETCPLILDRFLAPENFLKNITKCRGNCTFDD